MSDNLIFDIKNIKEENIYIGEIWMIKKVFNELIEYSKKQYPLISGFSSVCFRTLAKKDAILIKVKENYFIDIDFIKSNKEIELINEAIKNGCKNNNIFLTEDTYDPYVGQLYLENLKTANKLDKDKVIKKLTK